MIWNIEQGLALDGARIGRAELLRTELFHRMRRSWSKYDFLLAPVNQLPPFPVDEEYPTEIAGVKLGNYLDWMKSCYYITITSHPAISVPAGFTDDATAAGGPADRRPLPRRSRRAAARARVRAGDRRMAAAAVHRDRLGLELTAANGEAARAFDDTVWAYVGFSREPGAPAQARAAGGSRTCRWRCACRATSCI